MIEMIKFMMGGGKKEKKVEKGSWHIITEINIVACGRIMYFTVKVHTKKMAFAYMSDNLKMENIKINVPKWHTTMEMFTKVSFQMEKKMGTGFTIGLMETIMTANGKTIFLQEREFQWLALISMTVIF